MPHIEWSIDLGGVIMTVIAVICIPVTRSLISTLWAVREAVAELTVAVFGTDKDRSIGLVAHLAELKKESVRHRNWLIKLSTETGSKIEDRT